MAELENKRKEIVDIAPINKHHLNIGRFNRLLLPCALRNISFTAEVGEINDEQKIKSNLEEVISTVLEY